MDTDQIHEVKENRQALATLRYNERQDKKRSRENKAGGLLGGHLLRTNSRPGSNAFLE